MKTIRINEIKDLYKRCGLDANNKNQQIRTTINTGTLNNKLIFNFASGNKSIVKTTVSRNTSR